MLYSKAAKTVKKKIVFLQNFSLELREHALYSRWVAFEFFAFRHSL